MEQVPHGPCPDEYLFSYGKCELMKILTAKINTCTSLVEITEVLIHVQRTLFIYLVYLTLCVTRTKHIKFYWGTSTFQELIGQAGLHVVIRIMFDYSFLNVLETLFRTAYNASHWMERIRTWKYFIPCFG